MSTNLTKFVFFGVVGLFVASNSIADDKNFGKLIPTDSEIIQHFKPNAVAETQTETTSTDDYQDVSQDDLKNVRGLKKINISNIGENAARKSQSSTNLASTDEKAISLQILFDYKSANLSDSAKQQLDPVGRALASGDLSGLKFRIEGHTDAIGGDSYNLDLSKHRAEIVKQYLIEKYGINTAAVEIEGKGKFDLADPNNPSSEVNRRVRIVSVLR
jgi:outer membrane protein OmpA-like peptidoglycan-associated protein